MGILTAVKRTRASPLIRRNSVPGAQESLTLKPFPFRSRHAQTNHGYSRQIKATGGPTKSMITHSIPAFCEHLDVSARTPVKANQG
jgi:hypothetical protein